MLAATVFYAPFILRGRQHWHQGAGEEHEPGVFRLVTVLDGTHRLGRGNAAQRAGPGDVYLLQPDHVFRVQASRGAHANMLAFVTDPRLQVESDASGSGHLIDRASRHPGAAQIWGCALPTVLAPELARYLVPRIRWMCNTWWRDPWHHYLANQGLATSLERVARHYHHLAEEDAAAPRAADTPAHRMRQLIDEHVAIIHTTEALAERMGMSLDGVRRSFLACHGESPAAYIRRRRIDMAQEALSTSAESMCAIGRRLGFASVSAFSQFCRRHLGCSPSAWRRQG